MSNPKPFFRPAPIHALVEHFDLDVPEQEDDDA
jgi:hypothetical protein